jgi:hypothetical protein
VITSEFSLQTVEASTQSSSSFVLGLAAEDDEGKPNRRIPDGLNIPIRRSMQGTAGEKAYTGRKR